MSIYDDLLPVASSLMAEFKQGTITLVQLTTGTGPADNPGAPTETVTTLDAVTTEGALFKYFKEGLAVAGDIVVKSAIAAVTPSKNDFIAINSVRYKIVEFKPLPLAAPVVWEFLVRRG